MESTAFARPVSQANVQLGCRVVRGAHWTGLDEDAGGFGVIRAFARADGVVVKDPNFTSTRGVINPMFAIAAWDASQVQGLYSIGANGVFALAIWDPAVKGRRSSFTAANARASLTGEPNVKGSPASAATVALKKGVKFQKVDKHGRVKEIRMHLDDDESTLWRDTNKKAKVADKADIPLLNIDRCLRGQMTTHWAKLKGKFEKQGDQSFSICYGGQTLDLICESEADRDMWHHCILTLSELL